MEHESNKKITFVHLVEKLLNEAKKKKEKSEGKGKAKEKMADKDYDGDGKVETSKEEYFGSKDKAIKKAMGKKEIVSKDKKKVLKEGTSISDGKFTYGGFPRILKEEEKKSPEYFIPANPKEEEEHKDNPATVGMGEMHKLLSGPSHPLMAGQVKGGPRGVPDEIRKEALAHLETLQKHPKGKVEGYSPEHEFYKQAKAAHKFFKSTFPEFGVAGHIKDEYNLENE
jgi:hypothetical protein